MINSIPDIPRIYTAFAEWLMCLIIILCLKKRFSNRFITAGISVGVFAALAVFLSVTVSVPLVLWIPCMALAVLIMLGYIYATCSIRLLDAAYFTMHAFVLAEFVASLEWQIACNFLRRDIILPEWSELLMRYFNNYLFRSDCIAVFIVIYAVAAILIYQVVRKRIPSNGYMEITRMEAVSALIICVAVFAISNISFIASTDLLLDTYSYDIANARTLIDAGGVALLYAHLTQCREIRYRKELETVEGVLQTQYMQYQMSKEAIELVNYKYHDLKHQIAILRSEQDDGKRNAFLDQMEEEIHQYEAHNKTGNHVLDTILTSKSLTCEQRQITLTSVADGKQLNFMSTMDISSIFGNALDNAIEYEEKIEDPQKRMIHVVVARQQGYVLIRVENYFEGELEFKDGTPLTTKGDRDLHGYGIKSIRYIVQKYDGALHIKHRNGWFELQILIPVKEDG